LGELIQDDRKSILFSTHVTSDIEKIADYITFIDSGQLIFSCPRDDVFERYGVVKGGDELLKDETKNLFVGYRKNRFGVEALTNNIESAKELFGELEETVIEKATLEDIMYFTRREGGKDV
jgi:ABC-2 type transport system ATP-binding protein